MHQDPTDSWSRIAECLNRFPTPFRAAWLRRAIASLPSLAPHSAAISDAVEQLDDPPTVRPGFAAAVLDTVPPESINELERALNDAYMARVHCYVMQREMRRLRRYPDDVWRDSLLDALVDAALSQSETSSVLHWWERAERDPTIPLDDLFPALSVDALTRFRRVLHRHRRRLDRARAEPGGHSLESIEFASGPESVERRVWGDEERQALTWALGELDDRAGAILRMRLLLGRKLQSIADELGASLGKTYAEFQEALGQLRALMKKYPSRPDAILDADLDRVDRNVAELQQLVATLGEPGIGRPRVVTRGMPYAPQVTELRRIFGKLGDALLQLASDRELVPEGSDLPPERILRLARSIEVVVETLSGYARRALVAAHELPDDLCDADRLQALRDAASAAMKRDARNRPVSDAESYRALARAIRAYLMG